MGCGYTIGLDLGQAADFSALAVLERSFGAEGGVGLADYAVRHLKRFSLGRAYTHIVPAVAAIAASGPLRGAPLVVDQTGVGRAVVDMLRRSGIAGQIVPITITGGYAVTLGQEGAQHVPKKELVTCLQVLLQARRLKIARSLPEADRLARELENYRVKITVAANEIFGAWREGQHDDLVLATALTAWWAERQPRLCLEGITYGGSLIDEELRRAFPNG
jgi:hypothetical protein